MTQVDITYEGITFTATGHYDPGIPADPRNDEPGCGPFFWLHEVWHPTDGTWKRRHGNPPWTPAFRDLHPKDWYKIEAMALEALNDRT